ncbi:MAG TPA: YceI family protein [Candidatus Baltobacteraceae bacterium]|jgi:polyisoprenoid-binding protein YceI|nr:YceI family protein [Candidatus Baltobacteraceae bacterium]
MSRYIFAGMFCILGLTHGTLTFAGPTNQFAIDPVKSTVQFSIEHIFVDRVVGSVPLLSGTVNLPIDSLIPISAAVTLDATRIHTDDPDRDASLESADYFDAKKFSTWTFTSTKIVPASPTSFGMDGMLTIHGVTQPEHLDVSILGDASNPTYHATGHIDRHVFGMKGARLDPVIGNIADVTLDIKLRAQAESKQP